MSKNKVSSYTLTYEKNGEVITEHFEDFQKYMERMRKVIGESSNIKENKQDSKKMLFD